MIASKERTIELVSKIKRRLSDINNSSTFADIKKKMVNMLIY